MQISNHVLNCVKILFISIWIFWKDEYVLQVFLGVHLLRMTTASSSMLKVGFAVAEEANVW